MAEGHKKQLIEKEIKAFELEYSSSEVSKKVAESNSTGVSQPTSKVATDRNNDWVDSVSSQAPPDVASAPICWPSLMYQFRQNRRLPPTSFMQFTAEMVITMGTHH